MKTLQRIILILAILQLLLLLSIFFNSDKPIAPIEKETQSFEVKGSFNKCEWITLDTVIVINTNDYDLNKYKYYKFEFIYN